jgi:PPM family protein phosphatase
MAKMENAQFEIGYSTDRGRKRNLTPNQDSLVVLSYPSRPDLPPVMIVADGMGGYTGGAAASQIIIDTFRETYLAQKSPFSFVNYCAQALDIALRKMLEKATSDPEYAGMGSTIVVGSIEENRLNIMNVGDSRAYLLHNGAFQQVNYDHSFVGEAMRAGVLSPAEAMTHPKKNQLTQSVSARRVAVSPYFGQFPFEKTDLLLLCSDGLWGVVAESMIQEVVSELSVQIAVEKLVKLANSRGGPDNISIIVCKRTGARIFNPYMKPD